MVDLGWYKEWNPSFSKQMWSQRLKKRSVGLLQLWMFQAWSKGSERVDWSTFSSPKKQHRSTPHLTLSKASNIQIKSKKYVEIVYWFMMVYDGSWWFMMVYVSKSILDQQSFPFQSTMIFPTFLRKTMETPTEPASTERRLALHTPTAPSAGFRPPQRPGDKILGDPIL